MTKFTFSEAWTRKAIELEGDANVSAGVPEPSDGPRPCYRIGRVLIPGCWGTVYSGDLRDCYCERTPSNGRLTKLEKQVSAIMDRLLAMPYHTPPPPTPPPPPDTPSGKV